MQFQSENKILFTSLQTGIFFLPFNEIFLISPLNEHKVQRKNILYRKQCRKSEFKTLNL